MESNLSAASIAVYSLLCQQNVISRFLKIYGMIGMAFLRLCQQVAVDRNSGEIQYLILRYSKSIWHRLHPQPIACQVYLAIYA